MRKIYSLLLCNLLVGFSLQAQSVGDYRSNNSGSWNTLTTWQRYTGSGWSTPTAGQGYPGQFASSSSATVTVRHDVVLNVSPATTIGTLEVTDQAELTTSGNPNLSVTGDMTLITEWIIFIFIPIPQPSSCLFGNGDLTVGGDLTIEAAGNLTFGTGDLNVSGATTLDLGAVLTNNGAFTTPSTVTVNSLILIGEFENNGTATLSNTAAGSLNGDGIWTQGTNAVLNYAGSTITVGTLNASNNGNIVNYNRNGAQTLDNPSSNTYYHLTVQGTGTKSSSSNLIINGDLLIAGTAQLDVNAGTDDITIAGDWTVTSSNADPFVQGTRTVTFAGTATQTITTVLSGGETFNTLVINNSSGTIPQVVLNDNVNVAGTLTMTDGIIQSSASALLIMLNGSTATIGSTASYVDGPIQYNMAVSGTTRTLNFPIGKNGLYGAAALQIRHSNATSYSYTAEVIASSAMDLGYTLASGTDRVSNLRYWSIKRGLTASPGTTNNGNITTGLNGPRIRLYYVPEDEVTQTATLTVVKNIGGGTAWYNIGAAATGTPSGNVFTNANATNFTSFSFFALANLNGGTNPLPIDLISFTAQLNNSEVDLKWSTASETNNDYFTIERAVDIEQFEPIMEIDGKGTTKEFNTYETTDPSPLYGRSYYRLKQTDFDGKYSYSSVQVVNYEGPQYATLTAYPSPLAANGTLTLKIEGLRETTKVPIQILSSRGQKIFDKVLEVKSPGTIIEKIPASQFSASGLYIIKAGETLYLTKKIVVE